MGSPRRTGLVAAALTAAAVAATVAAPAAVAADPWTTDVLSSWRRDCDFPGNDIGFALVTVEESCKLACAVLPKCTHWKWNRIDRQCWVKRGGAVRWGVRPAPGSVCGIMER